MKVYSNIQPQPVEITSLGKVSRIRLTQNIEPHETEDSTGCKYDEVVFEVPTTSNLQQRIESDFDIYFSYGEKVMENEKILAQRKAELSKLINGAELPTELVDLWDVVLFGGGE